MWVSATVAARSNCLYALSDRGYRCLVMIEAPTSFFWAEYLILAIGTGSTETLLLWWQNKGRRHSAKGGRRSLLGGNRIFGDLGE